MSRKCRSGRQSRTGSSSGRLIRTFLATDPKMNIFVLGGDGYCGWATALYLSAQGHRVAIADNFARRQWDSDLRIETLTPIRSMTDRLHVWKQLTGNTI